MHPCPMIWLMRASASSGVQSSGTIRSPSTIANSNSGGIDTADDQANVASGGIVRRTSAIRMK